MNTGRMGVKHEGENNDEVRVDGALANWKVRSCSPAKMDPPSPNFPL